MMPAANQGVGMNMGFPDVCLTPAAPAPIPIPYPNIGMNAMSMPFVPNVMVSMAPAQNMSAKPLMTNGDNAGVAHPLCMQPGGTIMGNPRILIGGMPASHLCVPTQGNNFNNPVGSKLVPSVTNVLLGFRGASGPVGYRVSSSPDLLHQLRSSFPTSLQADEVTMILRISLINRRASSGLLMTLRRMRRSGMRRLVVNLQGCSGGVVEDAALIARVLGWASKRGLLVDILIDRSTASSAELVAANLQDIGVARLLGQRSFGKSRACFGNFVAGTITEPVVVFTRSGGSRIEGVGVVPQVFLERGEITTWLKQRGWR